LKRHDRQRKFGPSAFPVQVSTSFSDLQEFGSKIIGPHIATERPSAPVRPYAPGMRKNRKFPRQRSALEFEIVVFNLAK
jgi:hypothetical protein